MVYEVTVGHTNISQTSYSPRKSIKHSSIPVGKNMKQTIYYIATKMIKILTWENM